jgi:hypothetical protein
MRKHPGNEVLRPSTEPAPDRGAAAPRELSREALRTVAGGIHNPCGCGDVWCRVCKEWRVRI